MQSLILTLHIIVCVLLVILILLQSGKEGMGVIFGGGNSTVFGSAGAGGILAKLTTLMAIIFIITSLSYTYVSSTRPATESVILDVHIEEPENAPLPSNKAATPPENASQSSGKQDNTTSTNTQEETESAPSASQQPTETPKPTDSDSQKLNPPTDQTPKAE